MSRIVRTYALAALAVFSAVLIGGIFHNLAIGAVAGLASVAAIWFAAKHIEGRHA